MQRALQRFLDGTHDPAALGPDAPASSVYVELGRGEFRVGRSLDALQSAYRVGARVTWRRMGDAAAAAGLAPEVLVRLGEAIFAYIDELAAESVEGYAAEQSATAGRRDRARGELVELLARPTPADAPAVKRLAVEAGWPVPNKLVAVQCASSAGSALARAAGTSLLLATAPEGDDVSHGFLGDPGAPGLRARLAQTLAGQAVWLGNTEEPADAARSLARATALRRLNPAPEGPRWADDHLAQLVLHADADALRRLAQYRLAPLSELPSGARTRAAATLRAYLDHEGSVTAMAAALHLHPQTVRYRLARLREQLGSELADPQARFELSLALRAD